MSNIERRYNIGQNVEVRAEGEKKVIRGYAAVFNSFSQDLGGFIERIAPTFFDSVLTDDVRVLKNHDSHYVLGRTSSGTARVFKDERGLAFEYDDPGTSYSNDLAISISRGDISQCSFGFVVRKDQWTKRKDGVMERTLLECEALYDVGPVTYPAYTDTSVAARSMTDIIEKEKKAFEEATKRDVELAKEILEGQRTIDRLTINSLKTIF